MFWVHLKHCAWLIASCKMVTSVLQIFRAVFLEQQRQADCQWPCALPQWRVHGCDLMLRSFASQFSLLSKLSSLGTQPNRGVCCLDKFLKLFIIFNCCIGATYRPIFWDITPCFPVKVNSRYGWIYRFHRQGRKTSQVRNQRETGSGWLDSVALYSSR